MNFMIGILTTFLLLNIVPMIVDKAFQPSIQKGDNISGGYIIHASAKVKKFLVIFGLTGVFLLLFSVLINATELIYFGIFYVFLGCLNTLLYYKNRIHVIGETIKVSWFLKKTKTYSFSEITKAEIFNGRLVVYQKEKKIFRVPPIYWGYTQFLKDLENHEIVVGD